MYICNMTALEKNIVRFAWISLVLVHLVILAGSVVRMTGSGMGCPDWPQCFGYTIPPTDVEQVTWKPDHAYQEGQMIVFEEELLVAQRDFNSAHVLEINNWKAYEKHDYATFNPFHTWVEFINRLIGALTGLPVLILAFMTFLYARRTKNWTIFALGFATLFMLGFEAWLGKLVVDGNLVPGSITIHMFGSILIVFLLLSIIRMLKPKKVATENRYIRPLAIGFIGLGLLQVFLGTQVREEVDALIHSGVLDRTSWVYNLSWIFIVHRSFSWVILLVSAVLLFWLKKERIVFKLNMGIQALVVFQMICGILLAESFPMFVQPAHLMGAIILLGTLWSLQFRLKKA